MSDFEERMIDAVDSGHVTEDAAYEYMREGYADKADAARKAAKETPRTLESLAKERSAAVDAANHWHDRAKKAQADLREAERILRVLRRTAPIVPIQELAAINEWLERRNP